MLLVEDRALLDAFRRGERDALVRVYRQYAAGVSQVLRGGFTFSSGGRQCRFHGARPGFDLEDRVQETFSRAFTERARLGYDGLSPYGPYLHTIARNLVIDEFRKKARVFESFSVEAPEPDPGDRPEPGSEPLLGHVDPTGDPAEDVTRRQLVGHVAAFAESLSEREAEVYRLRFVEELEHREIAARTGLSPSKVKTSEQRIRAGFFRFMRDHGYFAGYEDRGRGWLRWVGRLRGGES